MLGVFMGNDYFSFKQFTVRHNRCAMKVGTDGVLLGAWASPAERGGKILDIGTGSGVIALMSAQRNPLSLVDAVEIDVKSALQAVENVHASPWSGRIKIHNCSFHDFYASGAAGRYQLIISNPPYFDTSFKSGNAARCAARQTVSISHGELLAGVSALLSDIGLFSLILPADISAVFMESASLWGLYPARICNVLPTPQQQPKRTLMELSFSAAECVTDTIILEEFGRHKYSEKYMHLTKDFYLNF